MQERIVFSILCSRLRAIARTRRLDQEFDCAQYQKRKVYIYMGSSLSFYYRILLYCIYFKMSDSAMKTKVVHPHCSVLSDNFKSGMFFDNYSHWCGWYKSMDDVKCNVYMKCCHPGLDGLKKVENNSIENMKMENNNNPVHKISINNYVFLVSKT